MTCKNHWNCLFLFNMSASLISRLFNVRLRQVIGKLSLHEKYMERDADNGLPRSVTLFFFRGHLSVNYNYTPNGRSTNATCRSSISAVHEDLVRYPEPKTASAGPECASSQTNRPTVPKLNNESVDGVSLSSCNMCAWVRR